jgi:hypothetical protein
MLMPRAVRGDMRSADVGCLFRASHDCHHRETWDSSILIIPNLFKSDIEDLFRSSFVGEPLVDGRPALSKWQW